MNITTVGVDLAKSVFQVHGVDKRGKVTIQKRLRRSKVLELFNRIDPKETLISLLGFSCRGDFAS